MKAHTVATLKKEIERRSAGEEVELVLMNLPVMDLCGGVGYGCGGGRFMGGEGREWVERGKMRAALCEFSYFHEMGSRY